MRWAPFVALIHVAACGKLRTLDYALLGAQSPCSRKFVPVVAGKPQFHSAAGREGCCVLDKSIAAMELKYAMSSCRSFRAAQRKAPAGATGTQAKINPCFAGAVELLRTSLHACCPPHSTTHCHAAIQQPLRLLDSSLEPQFRQCVSVENELEDANDSTCRRAAHASVRVISALLGAADKLYKESARDVTPASATMLTLCADVKDCSSRIKMFLGQNLGHAKLVVPAASDAPWVSDPSGCSRDVKLNCGFFDCPSITRAVCSAEIPSRHAVVLGRGTQHLGGTVDFRVPPSKQALSFAAPQWSITAWVKTSKPGTIVSKVSPSHTWAAPPHGANKALVITHDLKLRFTGSGMLATLGLQSKSVVGDGKWHSVALTYSSAFGASGGGLSLWIDGHRESGPLKARLPADPPAAVVKIGFAAEDFGPYLDGTLGDLIYWKVHLDADKIKQEAQAQPGGNRECFCPPRMCAVPLAKSSGIVKLRCVPHN